MNLQENLKKYAKLIVVSGLNLQENQILVIDASIECVELVRLITKEAYQYKAKEVVVHFHDEEISRQKYLHASQDVFETVPNWFSSFRNDYAKQNAAFLTIVSDDPEAMKGIDPTKIATWAKQVHHACKPFYDTLDLGINSWCIVGASSLSWAKKVYPELSNQEAVEQLWKAIFKATKVDQQDPIEAWKQHRKSFEKRVHYLNSLELDRMVYTNSLGTNLSIGMIDQYLFAGGGSYLTNGLYTFPNIPTEEIFCSPERNRTNGTVYSSMPLNYNGSLIDEFYLTFKDGKVVDYGAKQGYEMLKEIIETDEGSHYLGEAALVPYDSNISNMNLLFYNTLFDENASCHLALGKGFMECIKDGMKMNKEQLFDHGINDSYTHVDFMIGTKDLNIEGIKKDGTSIPIFKDGNFVF